MGFNVVEWSLTSLIWIIVAVLAFHVYKNQKEKTKSWKIVLLLLTGIFSFSFTIPIGGEFIRVAILPLGVMALAFLFRKKKEKWLVYRKYAWLGFWANYLFLFASLLSNPIHHAIYPEHLAHTYIAKFDEPSLMMIHPSGEERIVVQEEFEDALTTMTFQGDFPPLAWYYETENHEQTEPRYVEERFPYIVNGVVPKWGSGIESIVYMEKDGKGIMVSTPDGQYYFRSVQELFVEGEK
ncbi:hypothetical protein ACFOZY_06660 [Chungangia koreensis]|uniref:Uncharacterized protein n=1 Tax=Chungangia koreensis TaxID=752657 RepID=A0ABV8X4Q1_9LACT